MALTYPPSQGFYLREPWQDSTGLHQQKEYSPLEFVGFSVPASGDLRDFTVEMMVRFQSYDGRKDFFSRRNDSSESGEYTGYTGFSLYADDTSITVNGDGSSATAPSPAIGEWAHVALTYDYSGAGTMTLYVDGVEGGSYDDQYHGDGGDGLRSNRPGLPADAEVANFRLWDHARTAAQVAQDMSTDYPMDEPGLMVSISLGEPTDYFQVSEQGADFAAVYHTRFNFAAPVVQFAEEPRLSKSLKLGVREFEALSEPDVVYHGEISGTVTVKGDPAAQRVMAFNRKTGKKVAETTSASDGTYTLTGLDPEAAHYVVALDKNLEYNGVIADNITPEVPA